MVGERAGEEHAVAGPHALRPEIDAVGNRPDAGRRDVEPVGLAALDDLRVAGDDRDAGRARGGAHRGDDAPQVGDRESLLDHEAGRQPARLRADHREVVDGAVDGELADVAARELERMHDVGIGRECEAGAAGDDRRVAERRQRVVAELLEEERLDEVAGRLAAGAVRERDQLVAEDALPPRRQQAPRPAGAGGRRRRTRRRRPRSRPCTCRAGAPGVHAVPKTPHSHGLIWPVSTSPQRQAFGSSIRTPGNAEQLLRIPGGELRPQPQRAARDRAEAAPLELVAQLHRLVDRRERAGVPLGPHDARVLVLDLAAALGALAQQHRDRLQQVDGLEGRDRRPGGRTPPG